MKIVVTGSLGRISKTLAQELVSKGHAVTVISSDAGKQKEIERMGATAAIGTLQDIAFLSATFTGADAVYTMVPPPNYTDQSLDLKAYIHRIGGNYDQAIAQSGVKRVVHLSSIGAHLEKGTGLILEHRDVELMLDRLTDVAVTFMRPTAFHYNLYAYIPAIKHTGAMAANYGGNDKIVWVAPADIAVAIADEIVMPLTGRKVRYVASDELSCSEVASILGVAIGKPDLQWTTITDEQTLAHLLSAGLKPDIAAGLVEMQACMHTGVFFEDYYQNRPATLGSIKMTDFAKEFADAYNHN